MQASYQTERLRLRALQPTDAAFMLELVNSPGWLRFIGDRNVRSVSDANAYIERILNNSDQTYQVVALRGNEEAVGVVTIIRRDYLDYPDLGFAFLPRYVGYGYAYEAAAAVLTGLNNSGTPSILAITLPENTASIRLLLRLGFRPESALEREGKRLLVYTTR